MQRRSTLWFLLAAAWLVLLVVNMMHHRDLNTLVVAIAVVVFLVIGLLFRKREAKVLRSRKIR
jgi:archaellum biogenesis protein FlaJ (TadC family)